MDLINFIELPITPFLLALLLSNSSFTTLTLLSLSSQVSYHSFKDREFFPRISSNTKLLNQASCSSYAKSGQVWHFYHTIHIQPQNYRNLSLSTFGILTTIEHASLVPFMQ